MIVSAQTCRWKSAGKRLLRAPHHTTLHPVNPGCPPVLVRVNHSLPFCFWGFFLLLFSHVWLFATPWTAAHQAPLFFTIFQSFLKLKSIESVMPSNHLVLCHPLFLLPSVFPSIRVFSSESVLRIRCPKYWSFRISSVQFSHSIMSSSLPPHGLQHARLPWHQLLELTQIHVHWVSDTIQPSHPLSSPSPPAFSLSQHQGLFKWVNFSHQLAKVLEFQLQL